MTEENELNVEAMRTWVRYLRSGNYPQGFGRLNRAGQYCCLGVACEAAIDSGVKVGRALLSGGDIITYNGSIGNLPKVVSLWLGMPNELFLYKRWPWSKPELVDAVKLNDDLKVSFRKIAKAIERTYPEIKK